MHGLIVCSIFNVLCRVQALFYCPEGYAAQVIDTATNIELSNGVIDRSSSGSLSPPIDLDDLSEALNTTVAVLCNEIRKY